MTKTGQYKDSFTWLQRSVVKNSTFGNEFEVFTDNGILWGQFKSNSATEAVQYGVLLSQSEATVRFKQWVPLDAKDRLTYRQFNETYVITGVRRDGTDTIAELTKYDALGNIADV